MMRSNIPVRRRRHGVGQHTIPRGREPFRLLDEKRGAAEGATAPETLRQKDRDRVMNFWKARQHLLFPPKG
jgi:hypothetical protein